MAPDDGSTDALTKVVDIRMAMPKGIAHLKIRDIMAPEQVGLFRNLNANSLRLNTQNGSRQNRGGPSLSKDRKRKQLHRDCLYK